MLEFLLSGISYRKLVSVMTVRNVVCPCQILDRLLHYISESCPF